MIISSLIGIPAKAQQGIVDNIRVELPGKQNVTVHVARFLRSQVRPQLVVFDKPTPLLKWCKQHNIKNAINGGFSLHHTETLLGEIWTAGQKHGSIDFARPWHNRRGSVHITKKGRIKIAPRYYLPDEPDGDLLQAGPLLIHKGQSLIAPEADPEGFSAASDQLDDDWTGEARFPRAAIGSNDDFLFCTAVDGYMPGATVGKNTGVSLGEMAEILLYLGATEALNLDGGSSTTLVVNGKLINKPRAGARDEFTFFPAGRPIPNAVIFEPLTKFSLI